MRQMTLTASVNYQKSHSTYSPAEKRRKIWTWAAAASSLLGAAAGFAGLVFMILSLFEPSVMHSRIGGISLILVFPLFILAAHSLDKIEFAERAEKIEKLMNCRERVNSKQDYR